MEEPLSLYVYNNNFQLIGVVEKYISLIWSNRYSEPGDFELTVVYTDELRNLLQQDLYVTTDYTDRYAIIEKIEISKDDDGNSQMIVTGRTLESLLERRIILKELKFGEDNPENLQNSVQRILNENVINPEDSKRKIPGFIFKKNENKRITDLTIEDEKFDKDEVLSSISGICQDKHLGMRVIVNNTKEMEFSLYIGDDHSKDVLFSPYYDNLNNSEYYTDSEKYRNMAYIIKENNSTLTCSTLNDLPSGINRREICFNDNDLKENEKDKDMTDKELITNAVKKLNLEHKKETGFSGDIIPGAFYTYRTHYDVGDRVMLEDEYEDTEAVYISEIVITYDENGFSIIPTFEKIDWEWK